eukprot:7014414-Pyramimonas_sp.AAC.1
MRNPSSIFLRKCAAHASQAERARACAVPRGVRSENNAKGRTPHKMTPQLGPNFETRKEGSPPPLRCSSARTSRRWLSGMAPRASSR